MKTSFLKYTLIFFAIILMATSCKKDNQTITTCTIDNPLETIQWLKETKEAFELSMSPSAKRITQYFYQGECVFLIDGCLQCNDNLTTVYDVNQDIICEFGGIAGVDTCPDFDTEATDETILWDNL
jgi:hypothetical protein